MTSRPVRTYVSLLVLALVATGCATTGAAPRTVPTAGVAAELVPEAPGTADPAVATAWAALRTGGALPPATALSPAERATAVGQAYEGFRALRGGDSATAQNAFGGALGASPNFAEAQYGMGLVAQLQGRSDLADEWFTAALLSDPSLTRAAVEQNRLALAAVAPALRRAELAARSGDGAQAEVAYREVIDRAPFLVGPYLEIAQLRADGGDIDGALAALEGARRRLGDDPEVLKRLGDLFMDQGRYAEAADSYQRLVDVQPDNAAAVAAARRARDAFEAAALPSEYRTLAARDTISREELAAMIAIQLPQLEEYASGNQMIVADAGERWTTPYVLRTVQWGVLDVYQNNEFYPRMEVLRSMLVEAAYRVLDLVGAANSAPRPALSDPPPEHVLYGQVQAVVGAGILRTGRNGQFDLLEPVSGAEAVAAIEQLATVVRRHGS